MAYRYSSRRRSPRRGRAMRSRGGYPRRQNVWIRGQFSGTAAVAGTTRVTDLIPGTGIDEGAKVGSTVVRVRGRLTVVMLLPLTAPSASIYVGATIWPNDALATGPRPSEDRNDFDWFYWDSRPFSQEAIVGGTPAAGNYITSWDFDIKSSRRLTAPHETAILCVEYMGNPVVEDLLDTSTLLKLS